MYREIGWKIVIKLTRSHQQHRVYSDVHCSENFRRYAATSTTKRIHLIHYINRNAEIGKIDEGKSIFTNVGWYFGPPQSFHSIEALRIELERKTYATWITAVLFTHTHTCTANGKAHKLIFILLLVHLPLQRVHCACAMVCVPVIVK